MVKINCKRKLEITNLFNNYNIFLQLKWQTYGQNIYIIDFYSSDKSSQKVSVLYSKQYSRSWRFYMDIHLCPLLPDGQIINRIDTHQSDKSSQKKESDPYLKKQTRKSCFCIFTFLQFVTDGQIFHRIMRINHTNLHKKIRLLS